MSAGPLPGWLRSWSPAGWAMRMVPLREIKKVVQPVAGEARSNSLCAPAVTSSQGWRLRDKQDFGPDDLDRAAKTAGRCGDFHRCAAGQEPSTRIRLDDGAKGLATRVGHRVRR